MRSTSRALRMCCRFRAITWRSSPASSSSSSVRCSRWSRRSPCASDQEMCGLRRAARLDLLSAAVRRGSRDAALLLHDRHRAGRRDARPADDDLAHPGARRAGVLVLAPEAVAHPSFQMSFAATLALIAPMQIGLPFLKADMSTSTAHARCAVGRTRSRRAASWPRSSPVLPRRRIPPSISIARRLMASSPICSRCRSYPPSRCQPALSASSPCRSASTAPAGR